MSIVSIKNRARKGTLEVEHLLKEAAHPNDAFAKALDELSEELQWSYAAPLNDGRLLVPLGTWAKVVSTYCREGFQGMNRLATEPGFENFVIGLLEEIKKKESLDTLLLAFKDNLNEPCSDPDRSCRIASAVNLMLSFKPSVAADTEQAIELRAFLCALYTCSESDAQRAIALLALRGIGDESSAKFAASKVLASPWQDVPNMVGKHIRTSLRTATGTSRLKKQG